jgi:hypothetical protein
MLGQDVAHAACGDHLATRIARAEADAEWQDVTVPAAEHGLAALAGSSPTRAER